MPDNPFIIDLGDLASEWQRQPQLMREAGIREADARHAHSQAKARLAVTAAKLALAIRQAPTEYRLRAKPNKEEIEAAVEIEPDYVKALEEVNQLQYELDVAKAETVAFIDRRKALENEVELLALNYFSEQEPHARSDGAREEIRRRRIDRDSRGGGDDLG